MEVGMRTPFACQEPSRYPSIRFYPRHAPLDALLDAARESGVGLIEEEGRALLYSGAVQNLQRFAREFLERFGH